MDFEKFSSLAEKYGFELNYFSPEKRREHSIWVKERYSYGQIGLGGTL